MNKRCAASINRATGAAITELTAPPRPRLAFRVGVVGHRPDRLGQADLAQLGSVLVELLKRIKDAVEGAWDDELYAARDGRGVVLRALSPLAEGADRLFARVALDVGYSLCCVMPFAQTEYENDFAADKALAPDSLAEFRGLLDTARQRGGLVTYEMDGSRDDARAAYGSAGRVVLNQSDVLIVVWDGARQNKRGGTEEIFDAARGRGVPVVWIDARAPHTWQVVDAEHPLAKGREDQPATPAPTWDDQSLERAVAGVLDLPRPARPCHVAASPESSPQAVRGQMKTFYGEGKPGWSSAVFWGLFQGLVGDGAWPKVRFRIPGFETQVQNEWPTDRSTAISCVTDRLRPYYAWPDKLAVLYANRYRSAFLLAFLLAAFAVSMALVPVAIRAYGKDLPANVTECLDVWCSGLELASILAIVAVIGVGRRRHWHERWLNYRVVAELVRHLRLVAPLGGERPLPPIPAHWATYGPPSATWMAWYVRAVERDLGLPAAVVNKTHLLAGLDQLIELLGGQLAFHSRSAGRNDRIEGRLHFWGMGLLGITLAACLLHFGGDLRGWNLPTWLTVVLPLCCGVLPALGASLAGVANQGEFLRIHKRSQAMQEQLGVLLEGIQKIRAELQVEPPVPARPYAPLVSARASEAARLLVHELLDWRVVFLDRPLKEPA